MEDLTPAASSWVYAASKRIIIYSKTPRFSITRKKNKPTPRPLPSVEDSLSQLCKSIHISFYLLHDGG